MRIDLSALFAAAPSPYVLLDSDLRMVWVNDAYVDVTGRDRDTLIGRIMTEAFPAPADSTSDQMLRGSFRRVLETGRVDHLPLIPYPIKTATGQIIDRFWSATHTPILDADGRVEFILQNSMDVTDLYHSEHAASERTSPDQASVLQRAEAVANENLALGEMTRFFQSAFDQAPSFMAIVNGPQHEFQIVNRSYVDLVDGRDLVGLTVREALPELEGQGFFELLDRVYTTGEPVSIKGMGAQLKSPANGQMAQRFVDFIFHPIKDETGTPTGIFIQGHDVTGQKTAEAQLTATREKFRTMAQTMPNHVWTAEKDGGINWLNDRIYRFTGLREGDLYGTNWGRVVHPDDLETVSTQWADTIRHGKTYESEFRIQAADGSYRWHLVRASPLRSDDGALIGWVGTNTDIEERKSTENQIAQLNATLETRVAARNQELEELHATLRQSLKMEAIGSLAGGIAHDFNNLLQVITGNLQLLGREIAADSAGQERLDQAMKAVMRGATLASQLLSFARKQPLAPVVTNLRRLIGENWDILSSAIGEGVEIETQFADDLWNTNVDPNNMENALLNLAINARDAMERHGKLRISVENADLGAADVRAHPGLEPGQYVTLAVTDTGSGIPDDVAERIFEPFFTTKEDGKGTGLGLSMVYGFAKQSGGHVTIDSKVGKGTTIRIYLPRSLENEQVSDQTGSDGLSGGSETILLVEDDDDVRETAFSMLSDLGYTVLQAAGADTALQHLQGDAAIDLLFTDVVMPGKTTGQDLAEMARELRPGLPVLFTSGYVQDTIVHDGHLDEGLQLLGKPYTQLSMARKIRDVLALEGTPIQPRATCTQPPEEKRAPDRAASLKPHHILLCEDDPLIRMDVALGLRDAGYEVFEAPTAQGAIDILKAETIALLITDVGLPDRSGEELAVEARQFHPQLPIIFATGGLDVPAAETLGNCKVMTKPFRDVALLETIGTMNVGRAEMAD
ncbi:PAS domain-containing protein [Oceaniglobus ichthyenteri]|uniref:hybrid sensor histidine kinase/response regulator n=1 Tax=Oceaniglobus ichthyenteri TaxID=2136177 RepID=UPI000D3D317E|nr:PAS domain-containing protein [Oceaniglobus ichthyenteri]